MSSRSKLSGNGLAVAAAAAFAAASISGCAYFGHDGNAQVASAKGECHGVNACKGKSSCKGESHACKGQNACKGQGFVSLDKSTCQQVGGDFSQG